MKTEKILVKILQDIEIPSGISLSRAVRGQDGTFQMMGSRITTNIEKSNVIFSGKKVTTDPVTRTDPRNGQMLTVPSKEIYYVNRDRGNPIDISRAVLEGKVEVRKEVANMNADGEESEIEYSIPNTQFEFNGFEY